MFLKAWSIQNFGYDLRKPKSKSWLTIASLPFKELLPPTFQARVPHLRTIMANSSSNGNGSLYGLSQYVDLILRWPFCLHIHWNPQICSQSFESFFIVPLRRLKVAILSFSDIFLIIKLTCGWFQNPVADSSNLYKTTRSIKYGKILVPSIASCE